MKKYSSTTKGNYLHTSHKKRRLWLGISIVVVATGILLPWLILQVSAFVLYPFHAVTTWVKNSNDSIPVYLRSRSELVSEIESMKARTAIETGTQQSIERLLEENMQLRALTNIGTSTDRVIARVIARPDSLAYDYLQIDQGSNHGLFVGAPVYSGLDTVVGVVVQAAPEYAFVELITTPGFESTAYVIGPNVFSTLEGMGGGVARVRLPQGVSLDVGQLVLLPGITSGVYGEIAWIENHPTQPEQYGYVVPPLAMNSIFYVSVDTNSVQAKTEIEVEENIRQAIKEKMILNTVITGAIGSRIKSDIIDSNSTSTSTTSSTTVPAL